MKTAGRIAGLGVSLIRTMSDGAPPGAIPLGLGEPTWDLPESARRALVPAAGPLAYGPQGGRPELRRAIAAHHAADPDEVLVTVGTQEALFSVTQAYLEPGDAVLVPDPGFVGYGGVARIAGARIVPYPLATGDRFRLDASALLRVLEATPEARLVILGHPANPTGGGAFREALAAVAEACARRDVLLVSDEVYRELHFGERPPSRRDVTREGLVLSSVSKGFGAPGLRVGWIVGPPERLAPIRVIHGYAVTAASVPSQLAAAALLEDADDVLRSARAGLSERFDALAGAVRTQLGQVIDPPDGGFYHFHPLPPGAHADPLAHCLTLRDEHGVVVIPGLAFGEAGRGYTRISFAARPEQIVEGVRRLRGCWGPA